MDCTQLQQQAAALVSKIDAQYATQRTVQLTLAQLVEELGELAREVNSQTLRRKSPNAENLRGEFADVFLQLAHLAQAFDVNLAEAVVEKMDLLRRRHQAVS